MSTIARRAQGLTDQWRIDSRLVAKWAVAALLVVTIVGPLLFLLRTSVTPSRQSLLSGEVTLAHYTNALFNSGLENLIFNTIAYAAGSTFAAILVAAVLSWLTERTNIPFRTTITVMMFATMPLPTMVLCFGWIQLINPGNGLINNLLRNQLGLTASPFNIYSLEAMIFVTSLTLVPTAFVMIVGLLRNMDPQLERAASVHGGGRWSVLARVTLPLLRPGLFSVAMMTFLVTMQTFDVPFIIGMTARIQVLSTRMYLLSQSVQASPEYGLTAAFGVFFLFLALGLILFFFRIIRRSERYAVVTGKGFRPGRQDLGWWRYVALAVVVVYFVLVLAPVAMVFWMSLLPFYQHPSVAALSSVSLRNYTGIMAQYGTVSALTNTLVVSAVSATVVMALSVVIAWFSIRTKDRLSRIMDVLAFAPAAMPSVVIAVAMLFMLIGTPVFGSIWIIVLGHCIVFLCFGTRSLATALLQVHSELENAAIVSGAGWLTMLRRIVVPILWPQLLYGWLWVVAHSARDLTFPLFLNTGTNVVAAAQIWILWVTPNLPQASALAMILVAGILCVVVPLQLFAIKKMERS